MGQAKNIIFITALTLLLALPVFLSGQDKKEAAPSIVDDPIASMLDSLANVRYFDLEFKKVSLRKTSKFNFAQDSIPRYDESVYESRLAKIDAISPFDLVYHDAVKRYIEMYAMRKRSQVERMLGMSELYFPMFEEILDRYGLPLELKYLAIIESALNPLARSRAGATGLWQFMYGTGRMYNLRVNSYIDERCDPYKATVAACEYMKLLYDMFGNWEMVLAAYNSGPGTVNKAIRRSGGKKTYWEIRPYLPRETQAYVPAFIAVNYVMNHIEEHNLNVAYARQTNYRQVDTVKIKQQISFEQLSNVLNLPVEEIRFLNPTYRRGVIPYNAENPFALTLPSSKIGTFIANEHIIYNYLKSDSIANPVIGQVISRTHIVKRGEHLSTIARRYKCSVNDLKEWNHLKSTYINPGKKLLIYIQKPAILNQLPAIASQSETKEKAVSPAPVGKVKYHIVLPGDTLWNIAQKNGTTVSEIKRLNKLGSKFKLMPGQKIKVPTA